MVYEQCKQEKGRLKHALYFDGFQGALDTQIRVECLTHQSSGPMKP